MEQQTPPTKSTQYNPDIYTSYQPGRMQLSASVLKTLAYCFMIIDHIGAIIIADRISKGADLLSIYDITRSLGRLAFPIFAYLLIQGFRHSYNLGRYYKWLLVFAIIAEPCYDYAHSGSWVLSEEQNVLFTLAFSLCMLIALSKIRQLNLPNAACNLLSLFIVILTIAIGYWLKTDYGITGPLIILGLKYIDEHLKPNTTEMFGAMLGVVYVSYLIKNCIISPDNLTSLHGIVTLLRSAIGIQLYSALSIFIIAAYDGTRGKQLPKIIYYLIYPAHLLILGILK